MRPRPVVALVVTLTLLAVVLGVGLVVVALGASHGRDKLRTDLAISQARITALETALRTVGVDPKTIVVTVSPAPYPSASPARSPAPRAGRSTSVRSASPTSRPSRSSSPRPSPKPSPSPTCITVPVLGCRA